MEIRRERCSRKEPEKLIPPCPSEVKTIDPGETFSAENAAKIPVFKYLKPMWYVLKGSDKFRLDPQVGFTSAAMVSSLLKPFEVP